MTMQHNIDKFLQIGGLVRTMPYVLVFKTTNYCWFRCPHCCENSGPDQKRNYLPVGVIHFYLRQAVADPQFSGNVVYTGGEIMSAYRFGDKRYVPTLLKMAMGANIGTDIKTNAGWVRTTFGQEIYRDLCDVITSHKKYTLQISLSLDKFHTNCMENNVALLEKLSTDKIPVVAHISSFAGCNAMYPKMLEKLRMRGIKIEEMYMLGGENVRTVTTLNESVILTYSTGELFDGGRAKQLADAKHTEFPQFKFMTSDHQILMAFDTFGRVTLGENSGRKISVPWQTIFSNRIWNMDMIKRMLICNAQFAEMRAMIFDGWERLR